MSGFLVNRRAFLAAALTALVGVIAVNLMIGAVFDVDRLKEWDEFSFLAHERDDHGRLVSEVIAIHKTEPPAAGRLIIVGGSTVREGLLPDPVIQDALNTALANNAPSIRTLYSFDQSMAETARIILELPLTDLDTVVIGINPRRFGFGEDSLDREFNASRISLVPIDGLAATARSGEVDAARPEVDGFDERLNEFGDSDLFSPWVDTSLFEYRLFLRQWAEGRLSGHTTAAWSDLLAGRLSEVSWSALADLSSRDIRRPVRYGYANAPLPDREKAALAAEVAGTRVDDYFEHSTFDLALALELIAAIESTGATVVLLELPRSSLSTDAYGPVWDHYDTSVDALIDATEAIRLDLRELSFADEEFFDLEHLLAAARFRLTDAVIGGLTGADLGLSE
jgi:hypothetical protein